MRNTYLEISLDRIKNNLEHIRTQAPQTKICAVVKADAYGHGLVSVAKMLAQCHVDYFAVALAEEGQTLRESGITTPILVMGGIPEESMPLCINHRLTMTAASIDKLSCIKKHAQHIGTLAYVHLKIDTGMGRVGVHWNRASDFLAYAKNTERSGFVVCEGIYTHFADSCDDEYTKLQFDRFTRVLEQAQAIGLTLPIKHCASSRALFRYPEYHLSMVRPGIALYGIEPDIDRNILPPGIQPALSWKTEIVYFKVVTQNESVGYGRTWHPRKPFERVITLPIGYADGYARGLSNCGSVLIRGMRYPVIGRVCMDQCMVSLGGSGEAYVGDQVTLIGADGKESITVEDLARWLGTTPHDIIVHFSDRIPKIYV